MLGTQISLRDFILNQSNGANKMDYFQNVKSGHITNSHGEVNFFKVESGSVDVSQFTPSTIDGGSFIVGHSESGHNHILEAEGVTMLEHVSDGMKTLFAIVKNPVKLKQSAGDPHKEQVVEAGEYVVTCNIEVDPFTSQARRVAD